MTSMDIGALIESSADICGGRPHIAGTGVSVGRVVGWYKLGWSPQEIADRIGHLSLAQIYAALTHYHANRETTDAAFAAEDAEYVRLER